MTAVTDVALWLSRRLLAVLLLPLSVIPLCYAIPAVVREYESALSRSEAAQLVRPVLPAPVAGAAPGTFAPIPAYHGAVPVLVYHGVSDTSDKPLDVSRRAFAEQMDMLAQAGFHTVSIQQYARFVRGEAPALPASPILITFDDGRYDTWQGADRVLAEHGFRATMFTITSGAGDRHNPFYAHWPELRRMTASRRWDVQLHANDGHVLVPYDAAGREGPYYAYREFRDGSLESFAGFRRRVSRDLSTGVAELRRNLAGFRPVAFADPYGNHGNVRSNDARIAGYMREWLARRFDVTFTLRTPEYTTAHGARDDVHRHEVQHATTASNLYRWLRAANPGG